jgi:hypothetical protein
MHCIQAWTSLWLQATESERVNDRRITISKHATWGTYVTSHSRDVEKHDGGANDLGQEVTSTVDKYGCGVNDLFTHRRSRDANK